jgi:chromosome segregation ATPase
MMGILVIFVPVNGAKAEEKKAAYYGLKGLLENLAMGIDEKQAEMREMDLSLSAKRAELIELEKTIRRRQKLLDLTSREIEEGMLKLEEEKMKAQVDELVNCTTQVIITESLTVKREGVPFTWRP